MRFNRQFVSLVCLLVAVESTNICLAGEWIYQTGGISAALRGVKLVSQSRGFVVGDKGTILSTTDGGNTWSSLNLPITLDLFGVAFVDTLTGTVVGDSGTILQTNDGGATWQRRSSGTLACLRAITFSAPLNATVVGDVGTILRTTNGGVTWHAQTSGVTGSLKAVSFPTEAIGTAVGDSSAILRTVDGGLTWIKQSPGMLGSFISVACFDSLRGLATAAEGLVVHTTDGGAGWFRETDPPCCGSVSDVFFTDVNNGTLVGDKGRVFRTTDGGISWTPEAIMESSDWLAVHFLDSLSGTVVGSHGEIIHTSSGGGDSILFPVFLSSPLNGSDNQLIENPLSWHSFPDAIAYNIQVTTDSTFSTGFILSDSTVIDTFKNVANLQFGTRHFWRVKARIPGGSSIWSTVWNFRTSDYPELTVQQIQEQPLDSLLRADSFQNTLPSEWTLQAASYRGIPVRLTAFCVVPPTEILMGAPTMIACDTGAQLISWRGIPVQADSEYLPGGFMKIRPGYVLQMRGIVAELPEGNMNSTTVFRCRFFKIVDSLHSPPSPVDVSISDFYAGTYPGGVIKYSRGEQYEGMMVELRNVIVNRVIDLTRGTVELRDGNLNTMITSDVSRWFTFGSNRDSMCVYSLPPVGAHIDTLRGVILTGLATAAAESAYGYVIAPVAIGSIVYNPANQGVIKGFVFADLNADSTRNPGEPAMPFTEVGVSGDMNSTTSTDANGNFVFNGLGVGNYVVSKSLSFDATLTLPPTGFYLLTLGLHDTISGRDFGVHQSLNSISGLVFEDVNEDGRYDSLDRPLSGWVVQLNGYLSDSVITDTAGRYAFYRVYYGTSQVNLVMQPSWEQIYPQLQQGYTFTIQAVDQHYTGVSFSLHHIPPRVKLALTVHDNSFLDQRVVWWGVRPGATYGIWGVDPHCSNADFSEGEFELPPLLSLIFDARFLDPHGTDLQFGGGSWTDMRAYASSAQVDTYLVKFSPGRVDGADYPMTLLWSKQQVRSSYSGPVVLVDRFGFSVDLKQEDSLVVTNSNISSLILIAHNPLLPVEGVARGPARLPSEFALEQNFPNPFNPTTTFHYALAKDARVRLRVYNLLGQEVKTLVDGLQEAGYHSAEWGASDMASGVFFYRLEAVSLSEPIRSFVQVRKMLLVK